ncbi:MAG TPA: polysaccharide deacetylase family protein [Steroidobacteraceae bacterium]
MPYRPLNFRIWLLASLWLCLCTPCLAEKLAITFDDLPLNGILAPGMTRTGMVTDVVKLLKNADVPTVYGFVNAVKLEGDADGAAALQAWAAAGERVGNHGYSHLDLTETRAADFLSDVRRNEPALELLSRDSNWKWFRYPYLHEGNTLAKRREVRRQLLARGYRTAQVTIDYEDYLYNSPYARCLARKDEPAMAWLRSSYLALAAGYIDATGRWRNWCSGTASITCCCCTWAHSAARYCPIC